MPDIRYLISKFLGIRYSCGIKFYRRYHNLASEKCLRFLTDLLQLRNSQTTPSQNVKFISFETLQCTFPGPLSVSGYLVGVSVNGAKIGSTGGLSVYDSNCLSCNKDGAVRPKVSIDGPPPCAASSLFCSLL